MSRAIKYGKSNADYFRAKSGFYDADENAHNIAVAEKVSAKYTDQPLRTGCVACDAPLGPAQFTLRFGVPYSICARCGHLNGMHEDTAEFAEFAYVAGTVGESSIYTDIDRAAFDHRVTTTYVPKAEFLIEGLRARGEAPEKLAYADIGAGSGHYVAAMRACGLSDAVGYETSAEMVEAANRMYGHELLRWNDIAAVQEIAATVAADVLTMIFSLEHVIEMRGFLAAVRQNPRIRYFYFAVPTLSPSVFLEAVFPAVRSRVLGKGHTHLFTDRSIDWLCEEFGFARIADWWFGGNAFDLHRFVSVSLQSNPDIRAAAQVWDDLLAPMIDELQLAFDHARQSSEVHVLTAVERNSEHPARKRSVV